MGDRKRERSNIASSVMQPVNQQWKNKSVLITGHTGFKGSWLSLWLSDLGAKVQGISLDPPTDPNLFSVAKIASIIEADHRADIRDFTKLNNLLQKIKPEIVFHLAAQPLVQSSYDSPLETYATNIMGTANVLEAIRHCDSVRAALIVTTDKCYENREWIYPYRETDRLGGIDPYSSSKACAELVSAAYRASYFSSSPIHVATARAGNVIGGGDWADNRLIPDCIKAFCASTTLNLRYPQAIRPWQHVLESIHGYVLLAEKLLSEKGKEFATAWNFGPEQADIKSVGEVAGKVCELLGVSINMPNEKAQRHEASLLRLDSSKVKENLAWQARWSLPLAIEKTVEWYQQWLRDENMLTASRAQIAHFTGSA